MRGELGLSKMQMVVLLKKGKKLVKSGVVSESEFQELPQAETDSRGSMVPCNGIEISWDKNRLIRFSHVDELVEFLKKVA